VVVATYEACKTHIDRIRAIPWLCIVADEAHRLKNTETDTYKARALAGLQSPFAAVIMQ
jgi:SNF2 family DNA or RNA helicase